MAFGKPTLLRYILYISLLLNLVCAVYIVRRLVLRSKIPAYTPPPRLPYYLSRDKLFEAIPVDSNAIVFLGNSLTQYFELAELLPGFNVKTGAYTARFWKRPCNGLARSFNQSRKRFLLSWV